MALHQLLPVPIATRDILGTVRASDSVTVDPDGVMGVDVTVQLKPIRDMISEIVKELGGSVSGDKITWNHISVDGSQKTTYDVLKWLVENHVGKGDVYTKTEVDNLLKVIRQELSDILSKVYGGGTVGKDGKVTWGASGKIPVGNLNVFSQAADPSSKDTSYIRTTKGTNDNDLWFKAGK